MDIAIGIQEARIADRWREDHQGGKQGHPQAGEKGRHGRLSDDDGPILIPARPLRLMSGSLPIANVASAMGRVLSGKKDDVVSPPAGVIRHGRLLA
ncbi:hypothetical protein Sa4125_11290 [Aureimonas sp. SA4125]|nr:hypothetical protein Sa4125_11290 [Aureimonas sp. SA4125]